MNAKPGVWLLLGFAALHPLLASAQPYGYDYGSGWYGPGHMWGAGWGFGWFFPLLMILFFAVLCIGMMWLMRRTGGHGMHGAHWQGAPSDPTSAALRILNERFAKGEVQKQEYEEKKAMILASGSP